MTDPQRMAGALQPASPTQSAHHLRSLPSRPGPRWYLLTLPIFLLTLLGMVGSSNLLGFSVDFIAGHSLPLLGDGTQGFTLLLVADCLL